MKGSVLLFVMALLPVLAFAGCIDEVTRFHQVDARLVRAIAQAGLRMHTDAVDANNDGSTNIGLMQINSGWLPSLTRYDITRAYLFDTRVNAYVGSRILSRNIQQLGLTWDAVGAYSAKGPAKCLVYVRKVYQALATTNSIPSRIIANPVVSVRPVEALRATTRRLQTGMSSDTTIAPQEPPNK